MTEITEQIFKNNDWIVNEDCGKITLTKLLTYGGSFTFSIRASPYIQNNIDDILKAWSDFDTDKWVMDWLKAKEQGNQSVPSVLCLAKDAEEIDKTLLSTFDDLENLYVTKEAKNARTKFKTT